MKRREFLKCCGAGFITTVFWGCNQELKNVHTSSRPNLIILLCDDLGYGDLSCFGATHVETPNVDRLASDGMKFTQFYSASAVCSPTRASILTGRYPLRFDIRKHFEDREEHLPRGTVTLPKLLKEADYKTIHIGKWHLGGLNQKHIDDRSHSIPGPLEHGFYYYLCSLEDPAVRANLVATKRLYRDGCKTMVRNDRNVPPVDRNWEDYKVDEAINMIEKCHKDNERFFLNLWFDAPHAPYEPAPEPHLSKYKGRAEGDALFYSSMISHMDENVGRLVNKLKELNIYDNTFILFTSDNGPAWQGSPGPWKGGKTDLHEGGIRVPMCAVWPGHIKAGTQSNELAHTNDILPTFCAAAKVKLPSKPEFDGINLLPYLTGKESIKHRGIVFWQMDFYKGFQRFNPKPQPYATEVARKENWKLLAKDGEAVALYDLGSDPGETTDRLAQYPKIAKQLESELKKWLAAPRQSCLETNGATS